MYMNTLFKSVNMFKFFSIFLVFFFIGLIQCNQEIISSIACELDTMHLQCSAGYTILVQSANYGRTDSTTCPHDDMDDTECFAESSMDIVSNKCNNRLSCSIKASNSIFGNPCNTHKYLAVKYMCILVEPCTDTQFQCNDGTCIPLSAVLNGLQDCASGEDESGKDYKSAYACESHSLKLYCPRDEVISIVNANYGRLSPNICTPQFLSHAVCKADTSLHLVKRRCNGKGFCTVYAKSSEFGNPCFMKYKYLEVHFKCVKGQCDSSKFQCSQGQCIDSDLRCDGKWNCHKGEDENGCPYLTEIACQGSTLMIECKKNHAIQIIGANYGRQEPHICYKQTKLNKCVSTDAVNIVLDRCQGNITCNIDATNEEFGDPCPETSKYLSVNYYCVKMDEG